MNYIILDLEATCWKNRHEQNEIIEIGALSINDKMETVSEFAEFVKPIIHPKLSDFCTELTSIKQSDVDFADTFEKVLTRFWNWIDLEQDYILCSWGFYDKSQFKKDCLLHGLNTEWLKKHISLKHQYTKILNLRRNIGMVNALKNEKLPLDGTHHRGIDDARNIAKIFKAHFDKWAI